MPCKYKSIENVCFYSCRAMCLCQIMACGLYHFYYSAISENSAADA